MMENESKLRARLDLLSESEKIDLIIDLMKQGAQLTALLAQANERIAQLTARVTELEARLNMNSTNSSKPPSSDGYAKPQPKSLRQKSGRKPGGQKGHKGTTLRQVPNPDEIKIHEPERCVCGQGLDEAPIVHVERRQVFDLPERLVQVTEHQLVSRKCPQCGQVNRAVPPPEAPGPVQYGSRILGAAVYLHTAHLVPYARLTEIFDTIFQVKVCKRTVETAHTRAHTALNPFEETVRAQLADAPALHVDTTGMRVDGKLYRMHVASTRYLTVYQAHSGLGSEAIEEHGILPGFQGVLLHDCFPTYFRYGEKHALCGAHLLRELRGIGENEGHQWADEMFCLLEQMSRSGAASEGGTVSPEVADWFEGIYDEILRRGQSELPAPRKTPGKRGRAKNAKSANLHMRLGKHRESVLRFLRDPAVPFTNNQAERDLRMVKLRQKISGCERTPMGAHIFARIRSYVSTSRKQGQNLFQNIVDAVMGNPWIPQPLPSLT